MANSQWLATAIEHARIIHAHDYPSHTGIDGKRAPQLKRLWWCCILRDATLSLGLRRPPHISFKATSLRHSLFDLQDFREEIVASRVFDVSTKRIQVRLLSLFCALCWCMLESLEVLYPRWHKIRSSDSSAEHGQLQRRAFLDQCYRRLNDWYQVAADSEALAYSESSSNDRSLIMFKNLIFMMYQ